MVVLCKSVVFEGSQNLSYLDITQKVIFQNKYYQEVSNCKNTLKLDTKFMC